MAKLTRTQKAVLNQCEVGHMMAGTKLVESTRAEAAQLLGDASQHTVEFLKLRASSWKGQAYQASDSLKEGY